MKANGPVRVQAMGSINLCYLRKAACRSRGRATQARHYHPPHLARRHWCDPWSAKPDNDSHKHAWRNEGNPSMEFQILVCLELCNNGYDKCHLNQSSSAVCHQLFTSCHQLFSSVDNQFFTSCFHQLQSVVYKLSSVVYKLSSFVYKLSSVFYKLPSVVISCLQAVTSCNQLFTSCHLNQVF